LVVCGSLVVASADLLRQLGDIKDEGEDKKGFFGKIFKDK